MQTRTGEAARSSTERPSGCANGLAAVPIGVFFLRSADPAMLRITIGVVILLLGGLSLFKVQIPLTQRRFSGPLFGFLASLSVTTLSIGGPLAAVYVISQRWTSNTMRASLAFYFLVLDVLAFGLYAAVGLVDSETLVNIGLLVPGMLAGFGLATLIAKRINEAVFRYVTIAVIITGGVVLLVREITPL